MSRPRRGWSDAEVDEYVQAQQERRADARARDIREHPERWERIEDEFSDVFGPVWRRRED